MDADFSRKMPYTIPSDRIRPKPQDHRLFNPKHETKIAGAPHLKIDEPSGEGSTDTKDISQPHHQSPARQPAQCLASKPQHFQRQPGLLKLQRYDPRYPGLLLQPDSRPISQEQLASEVKSIYAGLTMVETKCIHVDRAQAAAVQDSSDTKLAPDHWQTLIALHRTLLHEHHDCTYFALIHTSSKCVLITIRHLQSFWHHNIRQRPQHYGG